MACIDTTNFAKRSLIQIEYVLLFSPYECSRGGSDTVETTLACIGTTNFAKRSLIQIGICMNELSVVVRYRCVETIPRVLQAVIRRI